MALLIAGYWQTTYWPDRYWDPNYWPHYGTPAVEEEEVTGVFPIRRQLNFDVPVQWLIRSKINVDLELSALIRSEYSSEISFNVFIRRMLDSNVKMEALIRTIFKESVYGKTVVVNNKLKNVLRVLKKFLVLEEAA